MIKEFQAGIAVCVQALTEQESQDFCWKGGRYFVEGDRASPSVGLSVGLADDPASSPQAAHPVSMRVEPLVFAQDNYGQRVSNVQILNAQKMLLEEATDLGVAQLLFQRWQQHWSTPAGEAKNNIEKPDTEAEAAPVLTDATMTSQL